MNLNYITDGLGNQSAIVISMDDWNKLMSRHNKLKRKLEILVGLQDAVEEVNMVKEGKLKLKSFKDFLDEN